MLNTTCNNIFACIGQCRKNALKKLTVFNDFKKNDLHHCYCALCAPPFQKETQNIQSQQDMLSKRPGHVISDKSHVTRSCWSTVYWHTFHSNTGTFYYAYSVNQHNFTSSNPCSLSVVTVQKVICVQHIHVFGCNFTEQPKQFNAQYLV